MEHRLWWGNLWQQCFWDVVGVIQMDFFEPGTVINRGLYFATFKFLKQQSTRIQGNQKNVWLQNSTAGPHTFHATVGCIQRLDLTILPYFPYSLDLLPYNFHVFPKVKEGLCGPQSLNEVVERTVKIWLQKQCVELFCDGSMELFYHRWKSVQLLGDNLENKYRKLKDILQEQFLHLIY